LHIDHDSQEESSNGLDGGTGDTKGSVEVMLGITGSTCKIQKFQFGTVWSQCGMCYTGFTIIGGSIS